MVDLIALKRKRASIKANLTRHEIFLKGYTTAAAFEIPVRISKADRLLVNFEMVQLDIEGLYDGEAQIDERDSFYSSYFNILGRLNDLALKVSKGGTQTQASQSSATATNPEVRLPAMEIPTFYGSYKNWSEFQDSFKTLVDVNATLSDIQKFYYLKGALKGSAAEVIHSLEVSNANYKEAWALLRERFENKKLIALSHIESMYNFPNMSKESHFELRRFVDEIRRDLRALKNLGFGVDHWDPLLIYIFEGKLDPVTRKEWQKQSAVDTFATMEKFMKFLANKCQLLETNSRKTSLSTSIDKGRPQTRAVLPHTTLKTYSAQRAQNCLACKSSEHHLQSCKRFLEMSIQGKRDLISKEGLCWNCLRSGHRVHACTSGSCKHCKGKHHSLKHEDQGRESDRYDRRSTETSGNSREAGQTERTFYGRRVESNSPLVQEEENKVSEVILSTAIIRIRGQEGELHSCRALLDCGSQSSFMTRELSNVLGLKPKATNISILGIGPDITKVSQMVTTRIFSAYTDYEADTGFLVIDHMSNTIPSINIDISKLKIPNNLLLADSSFGKRGEVDVLLGAAVFWDILETERIHLGNNQPIMQATKLGYIIAGQFSLGLNSSTRQALVQSCNLASRLSVQGLLERFWKVEEVGFARPLTREEEACEKFYFDTTRREVDGRFTVKLPFRTIPPNLGDSKEMALKRFYSMERKLGKDAESKELYNSFMREYINLGHMSIVEGAETAQLPRPVYYLPHHPVLKKSSLTTKLRVVFDASAITINGSSLNNHLMVGPKLQEDVFNILVRFRTHAVVITADVEKMFRQVWVAREDRDCQRILWRFEASEPVIEYRLNTVTYGMACSGYLAVKCMQQLTEGTPGNSESKDIVLKYFYMDDLLSGAESVEMARSLKEEISQMLALGGFMLRKWKSNRPEVFSSSNELSGIEHYISSDDNTARTSGIHWNSRHDTLHYDCPVENADKQTRFTKRQILSLVAQVFDPLGLVSPLVIRAKIVLQVLWKEKLGWDEVVSQEILSAWLEVQADFRKLNAIEINRQVVCDDFKDIQLHGFCDASQKAYGACIFLRSVDSAGKCHVHLLCSKSRVAPLKVISLPRLELCGALLLSKLTQSVLKSTGIEFSSVNCWTDSSIVLCWLAREPSSWNTFVANRTSKIQELTQGHHWGHVISEDNPADLVSRGVNGDTLKSSSLWWKGPSWLSGEKDRWPQFVVASDDMVPDQRKVRQVFITLDCSYIFDRFSSFNRLHRTMAWCVRFGQSCRLPKKERNTGPLTIEELDKAWVIIMRVIQDEFRSELTSLKGGNCVDKGSKLVSLCPFIDSNGLLRVGGRPSKAEIGYEQKFPVILPSKHRVTRLIILQEHYRYLHAGPQALLAQIRLRYWLTSGRQSIRSVLRKCIVCFRTKPREFRQFMGDLPRTRITVCRPFANCGVDYAGPFYVKAYKGRGFIKTKAYISVRVCMLRIEGGSSRTGGRPLNTVLPQLF